MITQSRREASVPEQELTFSQASVMAPKPQPRPQPTTTGLEPTTTGLVTGHAAVQALIREYKALESSTDAEASESANDAE